MVIGPFPLQPVIKNQQSKRMDHPQITPGLAQARESFAQRERLPYRGASPRASSASHSSNSGQSTAQVPKSAMCW